MTDIVIRVSAERAYEVRIGRGLTGALPAIVDGARKVAVLHPAALSGHAAEAAAELRGAGVEVTPIELPDAERAKTPEVLAHCWGVLGAAGFTRSDAIVSVGGGATTDLAGFVAATWLRGITVVHMPTTLLAMVDAAVGGKTGINTAAGKNLVGAFWSPAGVLCDVATLASLPVADLAAGMSEVAKIGFVRDVTILDDLEGRGPAALDVGGDLLPDLIRRAVQVKADVVGADFREESATRGDGRIGREVLNYGHTLGHAIEKREGYAWRHGDAISVGMVFVARLAELAGRLPAEDAQRHVRVLSSLGLPVSYPDGHWPQLSAAMAMDKKARGAVLRLVVLDGIGNPVVWADPEPGLLAAAYASITA